ncbi:hypothetical protein [Paramagnetospirillum caucaseum]|nr:hypothetical protein [Paramagnetospirillum caucaseum]
MVSGRLLVFALLLGLCASALQSIASVNDAAGIDTICSSGRQ